MEYIMFVVNILIKIVLIIVPLLMCVAYLTYAERRVIGLMQMRKGPNVVGIFGLLQPWADAIKLMFKEVILPINADKVMFILAPMVTFTLSIGAWAVIPVGIKMEVANINVGILYLLAVSSLSVYGIIIAGWASNSQYAFLGAIRSSAQMISYEVSIGLILITVLIVTGSLNITEIVMAQQDMKWYVHLLLFPMMIIFFISCLAETNRHPFDLPEAESELVAGYNVEYSSMTFAMFFLGEYANMVLASSMITILFMGGWLPPFNIGFLQCIPGVIWFVLKVIFWLFCFLWIRATLPRYRYDQLMRIGWKFFLPISLIWVVLVSGLLMYLNELPK
ncbi:MAG: NADH-quinone oxidoreductase subunit NuoH [Rickettsiales endosymbiont of Dermacentor nuttalli]